MNGEAPDRNHWRCGPVDRIDEISVGSDSENAAQIWLLDVRRLGAFVSGSLQTGLGADDTHIFAIRNAEQVQVFEKGQCVWHLERQKFLGLRHDVQQAAQSVEFHDSVVTVAVGDEDFTGGGHSYTSGLAEMVATYARLKTTANGYGRVVMVGLELKKFRKLKLFRNF